MTTKLSVEKSHRWYPQCPGSAQTFKFSEIKIHKSELTALSAKLNSVYEITIELTFGSMHFLGNPCVRASLDKIFSLASQLTDKWRL